MKNKLSLASLFLSAALLSSAAFASEAPLISRYLVFDEASDTAFMNQRLAVYDPATDSFYDVPYVISEPVAGAIGSVIRPVVFDTVADTAFLTQRVISYESTSDTLFTFGL